MVLSEAFGIRRKYYPPPPRDAADAVAQAEQRLTDAANAGGRAQLPFEQAREGIEIAKQMIAGGDDKDLPIAMEHAVGARLAATEAESLGRRASAMSPAQSPPPRRQEIAYVPHNEAARQKLYDYVNMEAAKRRDSENAARRNYEDELQATREMLNWRGR